MPTYLVVASAKHRGFPIPVESDLFLIGSNPECQIRSSHPDVAGEHCAILRQGMGHYVNALHDDPPPSLNGRAMNVGEETLLRQGDRIAVGPLEFLVGEHPSMDHDEVEAWAKEWLEDPTPSSTSEEDDDDEDDDDQDDIEENAASGAETVTGLEPSTSEEAPTERPLVTVTHQRGRLVAKLQIEELTDEHVLAQLNAQLRGQVARPNQQLLIDCKDVKELSVGGEILLAVWAGWIAGRGGSMALCRLLPEHQGRLRCLGSLGRVRFFPEIEVAMNATW